MKLRNGLRVTDLTTENIPVNIPPFVREAAKERGYGDATDTLSLFVHEADIAEAFECAAQGNGSKCVMAQAGTRIGAKAAYFYRTVAWIDFGEGPIVRFQTSKAIYNNVITPFDKGERDEVQAGIYHLTPPNPSRKLSTNRAYKRTHAPGKNLDGSRSPVAAHTERVVMASRSAA